MGDFADLARFRGRESALPPIAASLRVGTSAPTAAIDLDETTGTQPIAAFVCVIDYDGASRLITCRRYDTIGDLGYVGAVCHTAGGFRQFRCDRIECVYDASTGEELGNGAFFERFAVDSHRERTVTWGLSSSRRSTLVAGLNILAFMARCDGHWHPLETPIIESFVCSMWLRKEWEGDPPVHEIVAHAQRLAPDAAVFFSALRHYANSATSTRIIRRAVGDLIAADGLICENETQWGAEIDAFFHEYSEEQFRRYFLSSEGSGVAIALEFADAGTPAR